MSVILIPDPEESGRQEAAIAESQIKSLLARIEALEDALMPFARAAYIYPGCDDDVRVSFRRVNSKGASNCTLGDLRRASRAIESALDQPERTDSRR